MPADPAPELLSRHARTIDAYLREAIPRLCDGAPADLVGAIEYSVFAGGKRLRPALVLETALAAAPAGAARDTPRCALAAAGAIELIHTFSLVHDDLPAMDDDDLRRGRPTSHKVFGEAMAILAGDAMTTLAFEMIAADADPARVPALIGELSRAAGPAGMIGGQVLDIGAENTVLELEGLQRVHEMKTGALIVAAARMGAIAVGADAAALAAAGAYAAHVGLAFQIVDDLLDATSTPEQLGKATQKDASRGKNTYPALLGLEGARREAERQARCAVDAIGGWDGRADGLRRVAQFVLGRSS